MSLRSNILITSLLSVLTIFFFDVTGGNAASTSLTFDQLDAFVLVAEDDPLATPTLPTLNVSPAGITTLPFTGYNTIFPARNKSNKDFVTVDIGLTGLSLDLSGFSALELDVTNIDENPFGFGLFINDGSSKAGSSGQTVLINDESATLVLDFSTLPSGFDLTDIVEIGLRLTVDHSILAPVGDDAAEYRASPTPPSAVCSLSLSKTATPVPPPGECKGGITELTLVYTGAVCGGGDNPQLDNKGKAKFACSDDPVNTSPGEPVSIVITKDADLADVSPGAGINIGDMVVFTPSAANDKGKLKSDTKFNVIGPGGTQSLSIHTSCSKAIAPGDKFGSFVVDSFTSKDGGFVDGGGVAGDTEFTYNVTNTGDTTVDVIVTDDQFPDPNTFFPVGQVSNLAPDDMETFTAFGAFSDSNIATAVGTVINSSITCEVTATPEEPPPPPPASCPDSTKKVKVVEFEYTGEDCTITPNDQSGKASCTSTNGLSGDVDIVVEDKKGKFTYVDTTAVPVGGTVVVDAATEGKSKLESETVATVTDGNNSQTIKVHTSCSKPLAVGDRFGSLLVTDLELVNK